MFEQARIFAAMDGDPDLYSYCSAYQAIAYIVAGFILDNPSSDDFSRSKCLHWAIRLIEHSIICYSETGNDCYQKIKEKSGIGSGIKPEEIMGIRKYGKYLIQNIPPIREIPKNKEKLFYFRNVLEDIDNSEDKDLNSIYLDMAALSVKSDDLKYFTLTNINGVHLFGTYASVILFARGLYILCDPKNKNYKEFFADIELASRMLTYAWAIAEDGYVATEEYQLEREFFLTRKTGNKEENKYYNKYCEEYYEGFLELYKREIAYIRDIYPHRITEIADLGKIFAAVCKYLLLYCHPELDNYCLNKRDLEKDIKALLKRLHGLKAIDVPDFYCGQTDFNGHFRSSFNKVKSYLLEILEQEMKQYQEEENTTSQNKSIDDLSNLRDEVVQRIFRYLFEQDA